MLGLNVGGVSFTKKDIFLTAVFTLLFMLCVYPSFKNIGKLPVQLFSTFIMSAFVALAGLKVRNGIKIIAIASNLFLLSMISIGMVWQIILQIENIMQGESFYGWIYFFYYDKPFSVGLVWISVMLMYTSIRIFKIGSHSEKSILDYDLFFNISSRGFFLFYTLLLFYSFVIIRMPGSVASKTNIIPFKMIFEYFNQMGTKKYEMFFDFFGNLLYFTPLGFYAKVIKPEIKLPVIILLPIIISSSIELLQLIFKNGHCDIDDVILNSAGFYFGVAIKSAIDFVSTKRISGNGTSVFNWKKMSELKSTLPI